jgi:hypothetical protein
MADKSQKNKAKTNKPKLSVKERQKLKVQKLFQKILRTKKKQMRLYCTSHLTPRQRTPLSVRHLFQVKL